MQHSSCVKVDLDELAKAGRVVILECLRVAKSLKQRVRVKNLFFNCRFSADLCLSSLGFGLRRFFVQEVFFRSVKAFASPGKICEDNLRGLGLASTRLTRDDDRLIRPVYHQVLKAILCNHEEMRFWLLHVATTSLVLGELAILLSHCRVENAQSLEWIY